MKKYKLKKWYPSLSKCLKEGTKVIRFLGDDDFVSCDENCPASIPKFQVLNNPEFWEEVVEKDYEILSFRHKPETGIKAFYKNKKEFHLYFDEWHLNNIDIYSVKRLSDGEVFTVGDKICNTKSIKEKTQGCVTISNFKIVDDYLWIKHDTGFRSSENGWNEISHYIKKPLFTTEDGVDIFEGDSVWEATYCSGKKRLWNKPNMFKVLKVDIKVYLQEHYKLFSTKEAAEEYILMNKPCLSINDICDSNGNLFQLMAIAKDRNLSK